MISESENVQTKNRYKSNGHKSAQSFTQDGISISQLRAKLSGRIITPEDAEYDTARTLFAGGIDRRPAFIVRVATAADVSSVVKFAREKGLEIAVRSGGHSPAGHSVVEGGVVVDLRDMKDLKIDTVNHTAWAETGLTAFEYTTAVGVYGLATGFGDTGSVGIGGITLGGGAGFLVRKFGLTIDNLLAAEVVTADGKILHVDPQTHPDLFWAIRGGGGNFGIATRLQFRLHKVDSMVGGMMILPATPEIIAGFIAEAEAAPEELSTIINVMPAPPMPFVPPEFHGKLIVMASFAYVGNAESGEHVIVPFRALAKPIVDMVKPIHYPELFPPEVDDYHPTAITYGLFLDHVDISTSKTICDFLQSSDAPMRVAQLRVIGGAVARISPYATAYAHRQSRIMASLVAIYNSPEERIARETWVTNFTSAIQQEDSGVYVNFLGNEGEKRIRDAYPGKTWDRLAAIKARYDPTNLFHLNQNIPPSFDGLASAE
jgi:hypothetical protein